MPETDRHDEAAYLSSIFERQAGRVAEALREAAASVDRHTEVRPSLIDCLADHQRAAIEIVRDVQRSLANLPLDRLLEAAADADRYARESPGGDSK